MNNKTILITGGATRLGSLIAKYFAKKNYNIAIHYNNSNDSAKKLATEIATPNNIVNTYQADLLDHTTSETLITNVTKDFSSIDILINNASIFENNSFLDTDYNTLNQYLDIHLITPFFLIQNYAKSHKTGHIINITDTRITRNKTKYFPYLLSKKSLSNLSMMLASELAPHIKVNEICPGKILPSKDPQTDIPDHILKTKLPSKEITDSNQVIQTIDFIINNNPIGQKFFVDGGEHLL